MRGRFVPGRAASDVSSLTLYHPPNLAVPSVWVPTSAAAFASRLPSAVSTVFDLLRVGSRTARLLTRSWARKRLSPSWDP